MINLSYAMTQGSKYSVDRIYLIESRGSEAFNGRCQEMIEQGWIPATDFHLDNGVFRQQWIKQTIRVREDD